MDRRSALRTLATATVLPVVAPLDLSTMLDARRLVDGGPGALGSQEALTPHELSMVREVADVILPRTDTPSASDLGVASFIDRIVTEWMEPEERERFRAGLAELDSVARSRFGSDFAVLAEDEKGDLVAELDSQLPREAGGAFDRDAFYPVLKRLTLTGYFTTREGAGLAGYRLLPGTFQGCVTGVPR